MKKLVLMIALLCIFMPCANAESVTRQEIAITLPDATRTGFYTGTINDDGIPNGYGVFEAINSEDIPWRYIGEWNNGHITGEGYMSWDDGMALIGTFNDSYLQEGSTIVTGISATLEKNETLYTALVAIRNTIQRHIWDTDEWQEVTVPQGVWIVGEDIPSGTWTAKCAGKAYCTVISWGEQLTENGESIRFDGRYSYYNAVYNPNNVLFTEGLGTEYTFSVQKGDYVVIDSGAAIFMPYAGKPDLGFK